MTRRLAAVPAGAALAAMLAWSAAAGCGCAGPEVTDAGRAWRPLLDGRTLAGWKVSDFPGHGDVKVEDGRIVLEAGEFPLTGITWAGGDLPKTDYEIALEAMRIEGSDFFCGVTFPVGASHCSLILGGWGGRVVGLSSLNWMDAAHNETMGLRDFECGRWYGVRVRVTPAKIEAWINGRMAVNCGIEGRQVSIRFEMEPCVPLGVAAYATKAAVRNVRVRPVLE